MAWSTVTLRGSGSSKTSSLVINWSFTASAGSPLNSGDTLFLFASFDTLTDTTPAVTSIGRPTGTTNNWTKVANVNPAAGAGAASTVRGELWAIKVNATTTSNQSIAIGLSEAVTAKVAAGLSINGEADLTAIFDTIGNQDVGNGASGNLITQNGMLEIHVAAHESDAAFTMSPYGTATGGGTSGGGAASNVYALIAGGVRSGGGTSLTFSLTSSVSDRAWLALAIPEVSTGPVQHAGTMTVPVVTAQSMGGTKITPATMTTVDVVATNIATPSKITPAVMASAAVSTVTMNALKALPGSFTTAIVANGSMSATKQTPATVSTPAVVGSAFTAGVVTPASMVTAITSAVTVDATVLPFPASVLNIGPGGAQNHFELQVSPNTGSWFVKTQAELAAGYSNPDHFYTVGNRVTFRPRANGDIISGSIGARDELREVDEAGLAKKFDALAGEHILQGRTEIVHVPANDPDVVIAQLHDGAQDRISIRTQMFANGTIVLGVRINGTLHGTRFQNPYTGGEFQWKIRIINGTAEIYYNDMVTPLITSTALVPTVDPDGWYFKTGAYNQFNTTDTGATGLTVSAAEYSEVTLRDLSVVHNAPVGTIYDGSITVPLSSTVSVAPTNILSPATMLAPIASTVVANPTKITPATMGTPVASAVTAGGTKRTPATLGVDIISSMSGTITMRAPASKTTVILSTVTMVPTAILPASMTNSIVSAITMVASPPGTSILIPVIASQVFTPTARLGAAVTVAVTSALTINPTKRTPATLASAVVSTVIATATARRPATMSAGIVSTVNLSPAARMVATMLTPILSQLFVNGVIYEESTGAYIGSKPVLRIYATDSEMVTREVTKVYKGTELIWGSP